MGLLGAVVCTVAGALAVSTVGSSEGLRLKTYKDIVGVATYCYGETQGAKIGQVYTKQHCDDLLLRRLDEFANAVEGCVKSPMSDRVLVAFSSLAYNVGKVGFCQSSVVRFYNGGKREEACHAIMKFNKARVRGVLRPVDGLTLRRRREVAMCLEGLK